MEAAGGDGISDGSTTCSVGIGSKVEISVVGVSEVVGSTVKGSKVECFSEVVDISGVDGTSEVDGSSVSLNIGSDSMLNSVKLSGLGVS